MVKVMGRAGKLLADVCVCVCVRLCVCEWVQVGRVIRLSQEMERDIVGMEAFSVALVRPFLFALPVESRNPPVTRVRLQTWDASGHDIQLAQLHPHPATNRLPDLQFDFILMSFFFWCLKRFIFLMGERGSLCLFRPHAAIKSSEYSIIWQSTACGWRGRRHLPISIGWQIDTFEF